MKWISLIVLLTMDLCSMAQASGRSFIVNDQKVSDTLIRQLEKKYGVQFTPGNYWYDKVSGAYGVKGGPCTGIGIAGLSIGGNLRGDASSGGTGVFINGRELHPTDVLGFQTFMTVIPGRYWAHANGNFGNENNTMVVGNLYQLYQARFGSNRQTSSYKNNPWSGEKRSFGGDGSFMWYSSKKTDGTTYDYFID